MPADDSFRALLDYMETELGFSTSHYNDSYLDRRVTARLRRTKCDDYSEYFDQLRTDPDEQAALLDSMSINVTGFFRNPEVWDGIRDVLRTLSARERQVSIWSAACADGREPYSLSMLVHADPQIDESAVEIRATDISEDALDVARDGVYEESRTTDLGGELEYLSNYEQYVDHDREEGVYRVRDRVKRPVTFERHDLISGASKSGFNLVTCRNLFIYIDTEYKRSMLETIAQSLEEDGYLVIGKSETIPPSLKSTFEATDNRHRIYQRV
ncbi:protein-glutamate O-methyltransferase CheR [Natrialba magadii ATCC 43099]|uniref:protein-glutamate O-methyltransferase n=1 Tax=Natrialba magadii (strain ATCC 43099 / DSM 3394 / CCM 3739 / CIP 104546 / IAM 13178 / JCM 8861 / NBRC 102185 / NCIMB 2190 / MS3) TaxID=547559 RepID=D3T0F2_NATMM|nr:protein-glutamate O-methyltransferase CheR [Natrialba magadii]ADD06431.1 protein-glutamate O-methyltransferase CheR [Natrialba magadii ATCC 43099]ELY31682.1 CheR-type MCP methyltransferase [Natrialba magadii ATCC 43099]